MGNQIAKEDISPDSKRKLQSRLERGSKSLAASYSENNLHLEENRKQDLFSSLREEVSRSRNHKKKHKIQRQANSGSNDKFRAGSYQVKDRSSDSWLQENALQPLSYYLETTKQKDLYRNISHKELPEINNLKDIQSVPCIAINSNSHNLDDVMKIRDKNDLDQTYSFKDETESTCPEDENSRDCAPNSNINMTYDQSIDRDVISSPGQSVAINCQTQINNQNVRNEASINSCHLKLNNLSPNCKNSSSSFSSDGSSDTDNNATGIKVEPEAKIFSPVEKYKPRIVGETWKTGVIKQNCESFSNCLDNRDCSSMATSEDDSFEESDHDVTLMVENSSSLDCADINQDLQDYSPAASEGATACFVGKVGDQNLWSVPVGYSVKIYPSPADSKDQVMFEHHHPVVETELSDVKLMIESLHSVASKFRLLLRNFNNRNQTSSSGSTDGSTSSLTPSDSSDYVEEICDAVDRLESKLLKMDNIVEAFSNSRMLKRR